jgi:hypothetical protein
VLEIKIEIRNEGADGVGIIKNNLNEISKYYTHTESDI